jgi:hypothetical protein
MVLWPESDDHGCVEQPDRQVFVEFALLSIVEEQHSAASRVNDTMLDIVVLVVRHLGEDEASGLKGVAHLQVLDLDLPGMVSLVVNPHRCFSITR